MRVLPCRQRTRDMLIHLNSFPIAPLNFLCPRDKEFYPCLVQGYGTKLVSVHPKLHSLVKIPPFHDDETQKAVKLPIFGVVMGKLDTFSFKGMAVLGRTFYKTLQQDMHGVGSVVMRKIRFRLDVTACYPPNTADIG